MMIVTWNGLYMSLFTWNGLYMLFEEVEEYIGACLMLTETIHVACVWIVVHSNTFEVGVGWQVLKY